MASPSNAARAVPGKPINAVIFGHDSNASRARRAFTLIEMMVVIAIIIVMVGLLIGGFGTFFSFTNTAASQQFINQIAAALQNYERDFTDYPPSDWNALTPTASSFGVTSPFTDWTGAEIMCQALLGPSSADGVPGYGYIQVRKTGSYLRVTSDSTVVDNSPSGSPKTQYYLTTASSPNKRPFLYYRAKPAGQLASICTYDFTVNPITTTAKAENLRIWGTEGRFDTDHNFTLSGLGASEDIVKNYWALAPGAGGPSEKKGESFCASLRAAPYLMVFAGPDDTFGTKDDVTYPQP